MWSSRIQRGILTVAIGCWSFRLLMAQPAPNDRGTQSQMHCDELCDFSSWAMHAYCGERGLTDIPLLCSQVKTLDVRLNSIRTLFRARLSRFRDLKYLYLVDNGMSEVETGAFKGCSGIQFLSWGSNDFRVVGKHMLQGLSSLLYLLMGNSKIRTIELGAFDETPLLKTLDLSGNELEVPPCDAVSDGNVVTDLYLSGNRISTMPDGCFTKYTHLQRLKLDNNPLGAIANSLAFQGLGDLQQLELQNTSLTAVPVDAFRHVHGVDHVILSRNLIGSLEERDFAYVPFVEVLNLEYNRIRTIHQRTFDDLRNLRVLILSNNQIMSIGMYAFLSIEPSLEELHLHGNNLSSIENVSSSTIYSLQKLPIAGNPLECNCHLWHYRDWIEKGQEALDDLHLGATCLASSGKLVRIIESVQTEMKCLIQTTPSIRIYVEDSQLGFDQRLTVANWAVAQLQNSETHTQPSQTGSCSNNLIALIVIGIITIVFTSILFVGLLIYFFKLRRKKVKSKSKASQSC